MCPTPQTIQMHNTPITAYYQKSFLPARVLLIHDDPRVSMWNSSNNSQAVLSLLFPRIWTLSSYGSHLCELQRASKCTPSLPFKDISCSRACSLMHLSIWPTHILPQVGRISYTTAVAHCMYGLTCFLLLASLLLPSESVHWHSRDSLLGEEKTIGIQRLFATFHLVSDFSDSCLNGAGLPLSGSLGHLNLFSSTLLDSLGSWTRVMSPTELDAVPPWFAELPVSLLTLLLIEGGSHGTTGLILVKQVPRSSSMQHVCRANILYSEIFWCLHLVSFMMGRCYFFLP